MKRMTKEEAERILQQVAMKNHTTLDEVKREIKMAMVAGMCNQSSEVQKRWAEIPHDELLSAEEFLIYMSGQVEEKRSKKKRW